MDISPTRLLAGLPVPGWNKHRQREHFGAFFGQVGAMAIGAATYLWALEHDQLLQPGPGRIRARPAIRFPDLPGERGQLAWPGVSPNSPRAGVLRASSAAIRSWSLLIVLNMTLVAAPGVRAYLASV